MKKIVTTFLVSMLLFSMFSFGFLQTNATTEEDYFSLYPGHNWITTEKLSNGFGYNVKPLNNGGSTKFTLNTPLDLSQDTSKVSFELTINDFNDFECSDAATQKTRQLIIGLVDKKTASDITIDTRGWLGNPNMPKGIAASFYLNSKEDDAIGYEYFANGSQNTNYNGFWGTSEYPYFSGNSYIDYEKIRADSPSLVQEGYKNSIVKSFNGKNANNKLRFTYSIWAENSVVFDISSFKEDGTVNESFVQYIPLKNIERDVPLYLTFETMTADGTNGNIELDFAVENILNGAQTKTAESVTYDNSSSADIEIPVTIKGVPTSYLYKKVGEENEYLQSNSGDYYYKGDKVFIAKKYLDTLTNGTETYTFSTDLGAVSFNLIKNVVDAPTIAETANFKKSINMSDVSLAIELGGASVTNVKNGENVITETNYTLTSTSLVLKASYLETLEIGTNNIIITTAGGSDTCILTIANADAPTIAETAKFVLNDSKDLELTVSLNEASLEEIKLGDEILDTNKYILTGTKLTIKKDYLNTLKIGEYTLTIKTVAGKDTCKITIEEKAKDEEATVSGCGGAFSNNFGNEVMLFVVLSTLLVVISRTKYDSKNQK